METVIEGVTGTFFPEQTVDSMVEAMRRFEGMKFDKRVLRAHAEEFDDKVFKEKISMFVEEKVKEYNGMLNNIGQPEGGVPQCSNFLRFQTGCLYSGLCT